jgi:cytochrome P450
VTKLRAARDPRPGSRYPRRIRDQLLVFLLAGHETTAGALTFTLHQLGRDRQLQERVAGDQDLRRAALLEGIRLFPPAYVTERLALVDTEIDGYHVPSGTLVVVSPWVTHRHPRYWPKPDRYCPDRFLGEHDRPRYSYFPFGGGPQLYRRALRHAEAGILLRQLSSVTMSNRWTHGRDGGPTPSARRPVRARLIPADAPA